MSVLQEASWRLQLESTGSEPFKVLMDRKKRIGIYGGTFDPIHLGHIEVARRVYQLFEIDEVFFVPALQAPHKLTRDVASPLHRYAMLILATESDDRLKVSTFELDASDRRYTVDTLAHFQSRFVGTAELFFIMGADSWSEITTWREWEKLLSLTNHVVVTRPGFELQTEHLPTTVRQRVSDLRGAAGPAETDPAAKGGTIFISAAVMMDISATDIRHAAKENRYSDLAKLVPGSVAQYVKKYSLYRDSNEA